jgi:hypothetical protein
MTIPIHRNGDSRLCGASTVVSGQSTVYINGMLASIEGDPNDHGDGSLTASNNDGTVYIGGKLVNLLGSAALADALCIIDGPPHCGPIATSASPNVFACGGPKPTPSPSTGDAQIPAPASSGGSGGSGGGGTGGSGGGSGGGTGGPNVPANPSLSNQLSREALDNDPEFQKKLQELIEKYPGLTKDELYRVIQGESGFNSKAVNATSGATGLFQFMPSTANGLGYTTEQIQNMTPAQQLEVYDKYLGSFNYGGGPLGIMQAAPAYANKPGDFEVYSIGSKAWNQNPGWRGPDGRITVNSINNYYARQR